MACDRDFVVTLVSLRHHFWHVKAILGSLWVHFSYMMVTWKESEARFEGLIRLRDHLWRIRVTLEPLWGDFGVTFGM